MSNLRKFPPLLIVLALIGLGAGGYFYWQYREVKSQIAIFKNPQKAADLEKKQLLTEVGKLMALPLGEEPIIATVTDIEKLRDQPFFQKAKNGDKVLIFTGAKKAILYDPRAKKIIDVAPVNIGTGSAQKATIGPASGQTEEVKVVLRNGTKTVGLTVTVEPRITKAFPQVKVLERENAANDSYERTIVVVINNKLQDLAKNLAKSLKASVETLPAGEEEPGSVDLLIILGKDIAG